MNIRKIALKLLSEHEENGTFANLALQNHLTDSLSFEEKAFLTALFYTTVERKITLDYMIGALSKRGLNSVDTYTKNLLRIGLCQVLYMSNIPQFAAVNETVKLGRHEGERRFVNFVLREALRRKDDLPYPERERNVARYFSIFYSCPLWIVKELISLLGVEDAEKYLCTINTEPPLTLAVNLRKISRENFIELLKNQGIEAFPCLLSEAGIRLVGKYRPTSIVGFDEGLFFVQDEASQLVSQILAPTEGDTIVDVCACPGGKSFSCATRMGDRGEIASFDLHESKLPLIIKGAERLGLSSITAEVCDATQGKEALFGKADGVICDVPCSGLGVLWKKPDLRYKSEESIKELASLGLEILSRSASYLKSGGTLVFSTCTIRKEENEDVLYAFLKEHPDFSLVPFAVGERVCQEGILRLYPHTDSTDGFFIAKLQKTHKNT